MIGKNIDFLVSEPYKTEHGSNYLFAGQSKVFGVARETQALRANGEVFPLEISVSESIFGGRCASTWIVRDITERKRIEAELLESSQRLELALDTASGGVWEWNPVTDEWYASPQWLKSVGYLPGELPPHASSWKNLLHPDDFPKLFEKMKAHIEGKTPIHECEYRMLSKSGVWQWREGRGKLVARDASGRPLRVVGVDFDITERKNMAAVNTRLIEHLDATPNFVGFAEARDKRIIYMNPAGRAMMGIAADEDVTQFKVSDFHSPEMIQIIQSVAIPAAINGGTWEGETIFQSRDGREVPMWQVVAAHKSEGGEVVAFSTIATDITLHKQSEEKLKLYASELARSNDALRDFASIASHDLQEPLRKVISFGDRLRSVCVLGEQGEDYLGRMQKATQRMQSFICDLLEYSKVSHKPRELQLVNLNIIVAEVVSDLENKIAQTQGFVEVGDLPTIYADMLQMRQLLQNMIGNALKFHKPGVPPRVMVNSRQSVAGQWEIIIQDNGIGFDVKFLERIMKPFQRLHGRSQYEGSGIGMAICQKIVENHGGEITADSSPEKGTCFMVLLPEKQQ